MPSAVSVFIHHRSGFSDVQSLSVLSASWLMKLLPCRQKIRARQWSVQEPGLDYDVESDEDWSEPEDGESLTVSVQSFGYTLT